MTDKQLLKLFHRYRMKRDKAEGRLQRAAQHRFPGSEAAHKLWDKFEEYSEQAEALASEIETEMIRRCYGNIAPKQDA